MTGSDLEQGFEGVDFSAGGENPLVSDDPQSWDALVTATGPAGLLVFIEERLGPRLGATLESEDILQETYLHAWGSRHGFEWRGIRSFRGWLQQIAVNRIRDAADRANATKRGVDRTTLFSTVEANGGRIDPIRSTTPSRTARHRETATAMRTALSALPDELRPVVYHRLFEELSMQEVADEVGIGLSAAKHRFRKGAILYEDALIRAMHGGQLTRP